MEQAVVKILLLGICGYGSNYIKEISERDIPGIKIEGICEVVPNAADLYPILKNRTFQSIKRLRTSIKNIPPIWLLFQRPFICIIRRSSPA